jgi:hypothetical protein
LRARDGADVDHHHTRSIDIIAPDRIIAKPFVPMTFYRDGFGNCPPSAPPGRLRLSVGALLNDTGEPDSIALSGGC